MKNLKIGDTIHYLSVSPGYWIDELEDRWLTLTTTP